MKEFGEDKFLIMGTKKGIVKKTPLKDYSSIRKNGLNAINLREDDELIKVAVTSGDSEVMIFTSNGYAMRFNEKNVRPMGRTATGVKGITLREGDIAVSMDIVVPDEKVLMISENGYGKRTDVAEYAPHHRGGKGMKSYKVSEKTGKIAGARMVNEQDELMLINSSGVAIRLNVKDISTKSRNAMGVTLMRTNEEEKIVAIAKINSILSSFKLNRRTCSMRFWLEYIISMD